MSWSTLESGSTVFNVISIKLDFSLASSSTSGSVCAICRNKAFILNPALALVSINCTSSFSANLCPSSFVTCLAPERSILLPTNAMITSECRSSLTSWIHCFVLLNDARSDLFEFSRWCFLYKKKWKALFWERMRRTRNIIYHNSHVTISYVTRD